tara:strand:- start:103 stop:339 length:237 start_codon:yes stop_codon:yes gene_type:complete
MNILDIYPAFLEVKVGDIVIIKEGKEKRNWWSAQVIHTIGGARDHRENSLLQVVNVDTGLIKVINADLVYKVLQEKII